MNEKFVEWFNARGKRQSGITVEFMEEAFKAGKSTAVELLDAVSASEFDGISCNDVSSGNWFDARDEYKASLAP